jgi:hypothetical protein
MVIRYATALLSLAGMLALMMGLLLWAGFTVNLISMHMLLGFLAVGALWVIGVAQAFVRGGSWVLAAGALILGVLTIGIGLHQSSILVSDYHWVTRVSHLLLGILVIGLGHMGAARYRKIVHS